MMRLWSVCRAWAAVKRACASVRSCALGCWATGLGGVWAWCLRRVSERVRSCSAARRERRCCSLGVSVGGGGRLAVRRV
jgi:hypothetical protein